jgi:CMP-N,N'-diacetyllegionaminic acid synthase
VIDGKKILAVVTARAASKGLPGKNYKPLLGKPLIIWSLKAAFRCKYIDSIFVSTNCPEVKRTVSDWIGAARDEEWMHGPHGPRVIIVNRPDTLATPTSKNEEALLHAVQYYEEKYLATPDYVVNLQPTSPVRNDHLLDRCIESMYDNDCDSLLTVNKHTPFYWKIEDGSPKALYDFQNRPMRQQLKDEDYHFHDNGNVYVMTTDVLASTLCRIGSNPYLYETSPFQSLQIDTEFDFQLIEKMAELHGGVL